MSSDYEPFEVTDVAMMRAMAHPIRQQILAELVTRGHARAADLAEPLEQPANSISFHLRTLAKVGLIAEAPEFARDNRDRVWKPLSNDGYRTRDAGSATAPVMRWMRALLDKDENAFLGSEEDSLHTVAIAQSAFTKEELEDLLEELRDVTMRHARGALDEARKHPDAARRVHQLLVAAAPLLRTGGAQAD